MSVIAELTLFPLGKGESVGDYVAKIYGLIEQSGIDYMPGPMGTCIEGDWDEVMSLIDRCFKEMTKQSSRVYMTVAIDYRKDGLRRMRGKIDRIEGRISEKGE